MRTLFLRRTIAHHYQRVGECVCSRRHSPNLHVSCGFSSSSVSRQEGWKQKKVCTCGNVFFQTIDATRRLNMLFLLLLFLLLRGKLFCICLGCAFNAAGECLHGTCDHVLGACECDPGWTGASCEDNCPGFPPCGGEERGHCIQMDLESAVRRDDFFREIVGQ